MPLKRVENNCTEYNMALNLCTMTNSSCVFTKDPVSCPKYSGHHPVKHDNMSLVKKVIEKYGEKGITVEITSVELPQSKQDNATPEWF